MREWTWRKRSFTLSKWISNRKPVLEAQQLLIYFIMKACNSSSCVWRCYVHRLSKILLSFRLKASACLLHTDPRNSYLTRLPAKLPGMHYSADEQCQILFGTNATFCTDMEVCVSFIWERTDIILRSCTTCFHTVNGHNAVYVHTNKHWQHATETFWPAHVTESHWSYFIVVLALRSFLYVSSWRINLSRLHL